METFNMKKTIFTLVLIVLMALSVTTSCKRSSVPDPDSHKPSTFRVNLTGTANPSTLHVPFGNPPVYTDIIVEAQRNDGTLMSNFKIVFEQEGYGYFEGFRVSDARYTNGQGKAQIRYWVPSGSAVRTDTITNIRATLVDDGRFDNPIAAVFDLIPIQIIPYQPQLVCLHGKVLNIENAGVPNIIIELSNNGGVTLTRPSGSFSICVPPGWAGSLTPTTSLGYSFNPGNYVFENPLTTDVYNLNFYAQGGPITTISITPTDISFDIAGGTSGVTVYNSGSTTPIPYTISTAESWLTVDGSGARAGTTDTTHTITATVNPGAARTGQVTIFADDPTTNGSPLVLTVNQAGPSS
jgi:hypothetical protein